MRFAVVLVAFVAVGFAAPRGERLARAERMRERVRKAISFLQQARSYGEFAINTPTGLYPVGDINADNLPDVFRFRREFEELKNVEKTQLITMMDTLEAPAAPAKHVAEVEGSGVEGSGIEEDNTKKAHHKSGEKKEQFKRESLIEEDLLTDDSQGPNSWVAAPGKFEAARV